jgi:hypothetical protein
VFAGDEDWVNQYVPITARLAKALGVAMRGGSAMRDSIADSLAQQIGFEEPLGLFGMGVLLRLGLEEY